MFYNRASIHKNFLFTNPKLETFTNVRKCVIECTFPGSYSRSGRVCRGPIPRSAVSSRTYSRWRGRRRVSHHRRHGTRAGGALARQGITIPQSADNFTIKISIWELIDFNFRYKICGPFKVIEKIKTLWEITCSRTCASRHLPSRSIQLQLINVSFFAFDCRSTNVVVEITWTSRRRTCRRASPGVARDSLW